MSYEIKSSSKPDCATAFCLGNHPSSPSSTPSSISRVSSQCAPIYSQCGDLFNSITFLSRSLRRMNVDHAITGSSVVVMESLSSLPLLSTVELSIELVLSHSSFDHFLTRCVYQQIMPIAGEDRTFWDNRTGCTMKIYLVGEFIQVGLRSVQIPALDAIPMNDEGMRSWRPEVQSSRSGARTRQQQKIVKKVSHQSKTEVAA